LPVYIYKDSSAAEVHQLGLSAPRMALRVSPCLSRLPRSRAVRL